MITTANYLDIGNLIINEVVGNIWLTYLLILILIAVMAMKQRIKFGDTVTLMVFALFLLAGVYINSMVLIFIGLIVSVVLYIAMLRLLQT